MYKGFKTGLLTIICSLMVCSFINVPATEAVDQDDKVAVVNGAVISQEEFDMEMKPVQEVIEASGDSLSDIEIAALKIKVLENIIKYELLYQECQKEGVEISEEEINQRFDKERSNFSSDEEFQQRLVELGKDEESLKAQIRRTLSIQRLINQKFKPTITDNEAKKYYNSNPDEFKEGERTVPFDEAKAEIIRALGTQKIADSYNEFYAEVRDKADVDVFLDQ
jgi:hypothetical protein